MTVTESSEKANKLFYAQAAEKYETTGRINQDGNKARIKRLLSSVIRSLDKTQNKNQGSYAVGNIDVLDVCCGAGLYLKQLSIFIGAERLHGLDLSPEMLKVSAKYCQNLTEGSVYALPYESNRFNMVTCSSALHHLDNLDAALSEIHRVLQPGGVFLSDYDNNTLFAEYQKWLTRAGKVLTVAPVIEKLTREKASPKAPKPVEQMSIEELHAHAEAQNLHHDGVDAANLKRVAQKVGFVSCEVYTYHSHKWNDGVKMTPISSLFNNKIYTISTKRPDPKFRYNSIGF